MKRMRILAIGFGLVVAGAAVAATSASANPSFEECFKVNTRTGGYADKNCSIAVPGKTGKYELLIAGDPSFKGKGGAAILHTVIPGKGDIKVECASFKDSGQMVPAKFEKGVVAEFKKCKALGAPCQNAGGMVGTIKTNVLAGELGYLSMTGPAVGISLANESSPGAGYLAEFECTGLAKIRIHGALIGQILGIINKIGKESQVVYSVGPYLGEPSPGYTPLVNPPAFLSGTIGVLLTELNGPETGNVWAPPGGLPSGLEALATNKHPSIGISA
jgi:hypothetical protein